jgi:hypothetical protein
MKEVAEELQIPYNQVRDIVIGGQSAFTKHTMECEEFNSIRWPNFGTFRVKPYNVMVKKQMHGLEGIYRKLYRIQIKNGNVFPQRFKRVTDNAAFSFK